MTKVDDYNKKQARKDARRLYKEGYVGLPLPVYNSQAFKTLKPTAKVVLLEIIRRYNGRNNGHIVVGQKDFAKACFLSPKTVNQALKELELRYLIINTKKGHFTLREASEYLIPFRNVDNKSEYFNIWNERKDCFKQWPEEKESFPIKTK